MIKFIINMLERLNVTKLEEKEMRELGKLVDNAAEFLPSYICFVTVNNHNHLIYNELTKSVLCMFNLRPSNKSVYLVLNDAEPLDNYQYLIQDMFQSQFKNKLDDGEIELAYDEENGVILVGDEAVNFLTKRRGK